MIKIHKSQTKGNFWENNKEEIVYRYCILKESTSKISETFKCDKSTILKHLKSWDVSIRKQRCNAKYQINIDRFKTLNNELEAYWFGMFLADGHLSKDNVLMLTLKDREMIEQFRQFLETDAPIKQDKNKNYFINIRSKNLAETLRNKGIHNRKSYFLDLEKMLSFIPANMFHHFLRGLFDGDGCIKKYTYKYFKKPQYHFGMTGLYDTCLLFKKQFNIDRKLVKESDICYTCVTRNPQKIIEIMKFLYDDATIYLQRKYMVFESIVKDLQRL